MKTKILCILLLFITINACKKDTNIINEDLNTIKEESAHKYKSGNIPDQPYTHHKSKGFPSNLVSISPISDFTFWHPGNIRAVDYRPDTKEYRFYDLNGNYHHTKDFISWGTWIKINLPLYKYPNDIVGMFTTSDNNRTFTFYRDQTYSIGDGINMDRYSKCKSFKLPTNKSANNIVDVAILQYPLRPTIIFFWFDDGTVAYTGSLTSGNFTIENYTLSKLIMGVIMKPNESASEIFYY